MRKFKCLLLFIILQPLFSSAQDYGWWVDIHNWDGHTAWEHYMKLAPKYLGPNALPVPEITKGIMNESAVEAGYAGHYVDGDKTHNAFLRLNVSLGRAGIEVYGVPVEFYEMDTITRDKRISRDRDARGSANGDLYVHSYFQIIKDKNHVPDLLLRVGLKTASGNNLEGARFTDTPGYFFDLSAGKNYPLSSKTSLRIYAMAGFYAWQTYDVQYKQDDCFLYGAGVSIKYKHIVAEEQLGGYIGYIRNGDRPMVNRISLTTAFPKRVNGKIVFQQGLHDFEYSSILISGIVSLTKKKK